VIGLEGIAVQARCSSLWFHQITKEY